MSSVIRILGIASLVLACASFSSAYCLKDTYIGHDFFNGGWQWETFDDPTHGRVNFVDLATAQSKNLSFATYNKFVMRVDSTSQVLSSARGRDSVRITSKNSYEDAVFVLDVAHIPTGCTLWPAWWTKSQSGPWPNGGEIDIIEGVHLNTSNLASLHTISQCTMPSSRRQAGKTISTNCDANVNSNQGCGTSFTAPNSYGSSFNIGGGGWYVMEKSGIKGVSVWFWTRDDPSVPGAILQGRPTISTDSWKIPDAHFPSDSCDYPSHFDAHEITFDITLCGDWAGSPDIWAASGCDVDNRPDQFKEGYWEIDSLRIYIDSENCNADMTFDSAQAVVKVSRHI
ncbi:hypothetical protein H0H92_001943 [Tricholoma furcatifolium]|nr:hypothetical protein H0H92_001943 [Tricholoma furcatifolium]